MTKIKPRFRLWIFNVRILNEHIYNLLQYRMEFPSSIGSLLCCMLNRCILWYSMAGGFHDKLCRIAESNRKILSIHSPSFSPLSNILLIRWRGLGEPYKNVPKSGKSAKGGKGSVTKLKKSKFNMWTFWDEGGVGIFSFFPKFKCWLWMLQLRKKKLF